MNALRPAIRIAAALVVLLTAGAALADPCLVVYPMGDCTYHYDVNEYYLAGPGHPDWAPQYDFGGGMLVDLNDDEIAFDIYQAPGLSGFQVSTDGNEGYFFTGSSFQLVVDGFSNAPTTFVDIILVIEPLPVSCPPNVMIDGNPVAGGTYSLGDLAVSTPASGNNYSDSIVLDVEWDACAELEFWAYSDENHNGVKDGGECFSAFSHDTTVGNESTSIGAVKVRFDTQD